jgi:hypothetical protein
MPASRSLLSRFRLGVVSFLTATSVCAGTIPPSVHADYEEPFTMSASECLAPELLKGPHHRVLEQVQNDGFFNHYTVQSPFGEFTAPSTTMLKFLINELNAIAEMKKVETDDAAVASLKKSGQNTIKGIKSLFTDTEDTLKGAASGVQSIFHRASESIGSRDPTGAEDSRMKQVIGYSKSKGRIATSYQVNVYSRNQVLQKELDRLAWADYLGGLGVGVATSAIPGIGGVVLTTSGTARLLNEAINTTPASELWVQSRDKLMALGMDADTVQLFLNHDMFSPALYTVMTSALQSMREVDNLELFLKVSLPASTPEMARMITETAVLTAGYHKHVEPLASIVPMVRITRAVNRDGDAVVILPTDHLIWTEKTAGVLTEISEKVSASGGRETELWVLGDLSETMQRECTKKGWKVRTNVRAKLIPVER